ncbi:MAG: peptidase T, partial [Salinivirgaceae bacterium]|nr:peptidase T [Salinivirgaceae bacterium]
MKKIAERFMRYARIDTQSDERSTTCPSTAKQFNLIKSLADELNFLGLTKIDIDGNGYLFATIPSNVPYAVPAIGFIAHIDVSPDAPSENVKPQIISNYDGGDIVLNEAQNIVMSPADFPELRNYVGQDIITSDGTTLLGADDKAGVAAIMQMAEYVQNNSDFKHGPIKIAFTPDEEIGRGANLFDVKQFGADFAYTVDGGGIGEIEYENFNAAYAKITVTGKSVHPGSAKDKMVNATLLISRIIGSVPISST